MKTAISEKRHRPFLVLALVVSFLSLSACRVQLVPQYDAKIVVLTELSRKSVDKLYDAIQNATIESNERAFDLFACQYESVEDELQLLLQTIQERKKRNEARILLCKKTVLQFDDYMITTCDSTITMFERYKEIHRNRNMLNDTHICRHRGNIKRMLKTLLDSEEAKEEKVDK
ncbi:MAG: hypothetical protein LBM67_09155 [Lentimicrobiaceae bacterium]|jgi:hypothetical protein|nr:hypothetical protein [Lentimicrobiaceae bacterium]